MQSPYFGKKYQSVINYKGANARNVSTSFLPYGGITYLINSFDYPNLLCFNSPPTQHQFL